MGDQRLRVAAHRIENTLAIAALALVALLPAVESLSRSVFGRSFYSSSSYVQHLVLWIAFLGGMITSREGRHLALIAGVDMLKGRMGTAARILTGMLSVAITAALSVSSLSFALIGFGPDQTVGVFPLVAVSLIMPIGFAVISVRFAYTLSAAPRAAVTISCAFLVGLVLSWEPLFSILRVVLPQALVLEDVQFAIGTVLYPVLPILALPLIVLVIGATGFGLPLFVVLGGLALLLFTRSAGAIEVIPNEAYTLLTGPILPAIPLFTLTGFILSESRAADRLVGFFRVFFSWLRGGPIVVSILVCAFFTTFTGGSGVTILALGGLLLAVLLKSGYPKGFSTGLLTASGSIGLLFPPSLAVIMYGVTALISIKDLFIGGIVPGIVLVGATILVSQFLGRRNRKEKEEPTTGLEPGEARRVLWGSIWEILLPAIVLVSYFSGIATLVETAAISVVYVLVIEIFVRRDIALKDLPGVFLKCLPVVGGVLMILTVAKGFSFYIVDAQVPTRLTELAQLYVGSKIVFLILLNLALLATGCIMDIFSAILVVAPLVIPLGQAYGVDPIHLGIIFLANLELGYLTPPVGINLFLASYRFEEPITRIYGQIVPFLVVRFVAVLLITYLPWLTTALVSLVGG